MDFHFEDYNQIIALQALFPNGEEIWLPIIDKKGMPDFYNYSFNWVKWTFRVNSPEINKKILINGIRDFTAFWIYKNNYQADDIKFDIKVKKIQIPKE